MQQQGSLCRLDMESITIAKYETLTQAFGSTVGCVDVVILRTAVLSAYSKHCRRDRAENQRTTSSTNLGQVMPSAALSEGGDRRALG